MLRSKIRWTAMAVACGGLVLGGGCGGGLLIPLLLLGGLGGSIPGLGGLLGGLGGGG